MSKNSTPKFGKLKRRWAGFWMRRSSLSCFGRQAMRLASWVTPPHYKREALSGMGKFGYIAPTAILYHSNFKGAPKTFIDEHCVIFQNDGGGSIQINDDVRIYRNSTLETGKGGYITIGAHSSIHPRNQLNAYKRANH